MRTRVLKRMIGVRGKREGAEVGRVRKGMASLCQVCLPFAFVELHDDLGHFLLRFL